MGKFLEEHWLALLIGYGAIGVGVDLWNNSKSTDGTYSWGGVGGTTPPGATLTIETILLWPIAVVNIATNSSGS